MRSLRPSICFQPALYRLPYRAARVQGKPLLPLLGGEAGAAHDTIVSRSGAAKLSYTVRDGRHALLLRPGKARRLLHATDADAWQTRDVYTQQRSRAAALERAFTDFARAQHLPPEGFRESPVERKAKKLPGRPLSDEQRKTLKSLGYVE